MSVCLSAHQSKILEGLLPAIGIEIEKRIGRMYHSYGHFWGTRTDLIKEALSWATEVYNEVDVKKLGRTKIESFIAQRCLLRLIDGYRTFCVHSRRINAMKAALIKAQESVLKKHGYMSTDKIIEELSISESAKKAQEIVNSSQYFTHSIDQHCFDRNHGFGQRDLGGPLGPRDPFGQLQFDAIDNEDRYQTLIHQAYAFFSKLDKARPERRWKQVKNPSMNLGEDLCVISADPSKSEIGLDLATFARPRKDDKPLRSEIYVTILRDYYLAQAYDKPVSTFRQIGETFGMSESNISNMANNGLIKNFFVLYGLLKAA